MKDFSHLLNQILVEAYHNILRVEEEFLRKDNGIDLSIREMHLIECVGTDRESGKAVSEIAESLRIARPSVTVAVNKLEKRGLLERKGCHSDGRIVRIVLTREGRRIDSYHRRYHMRMVQEIEKAFDEQEKEYLIRAIIKLNDFFTGSGAVSQ